MDVPLPPLEEILMSCPRCGHASLEIIGAEPSPAGGDAGVMLVSFGCSRRGCTFSDNREWKPLRH